MTMMKWCLMSSYVSWHIRDKLWPMPKWWFNISLRPRKPEGSLGRPTQDGHLDSHTAPELCQETHKQYAYLSVTYRQNNNGVRIYTAVLVAVAVLFHFYPKQDDLFVLTLGTHSAEAGLVHFHFFLFFLQLLPFFPLEKWACPRNFARFVLSS